MTDPHAPWHSRARTFFTGDPTPMAEHGAVVVIGLGRFGASLARELTSLGVDVVGIDCDEAIVESLRDELPFVTRADATQDAALTQLGVPEASRVIIAIGSDLEASILAASRILRSGNDRVWAKAISEPHAEILAQLGVKQIVNPEDDMGRRLAHLIRGHMSDFLRIDSDYAIVRTTPPVRVLGQPLSALGLRGTHGVTVIAVKHPGAGWANTDGGTVLEADDEIIIAGAPDAVERFSALDKHV
ncbi:potassium channel family protein [Brevibacterium luteolum]|uniref:TrkA family potassium uptake protein n=1 Tax=Brevibacterium luteolum TaxID=199591 RepID=A0A849AV33_9MICO|nr:TrkA family potassium uptake protein [Brevibacterium luteolum]MBM7530233.1 trk system potassium uptake protein TrkA [Brevibacterium luteolum]NNG79875.1 TrkA family potassium uptake protein [Brevibacterium luteolum]